MLYLVQVLLFDTGNYLFYQFWFHTLRTLMRLNLKQLKLAQVLIQTPHRFNQINVMVHRSIIKTMNFPYFSVFLIWFENCMYLLSDLYVDDLYLICWWSMSRSRRWRNMWFDSFWFIRFSFDFSFLICLFVVQFLYWTYNYISLHG